MIDLSEVYYLSHAPKKRAVVVSIENINEQPFELLWGQLKPDGPVVCSPHLGDTFYDLIRSSYAAVVLISPRLVSVLRTNGFSGWKTYPVKGVGFKGDELDAYQVLSVTGRCGPLQNERSQRVLRPKVVPNGKPYWAYVGLFFDPQSWDGSDIFIPVNKGHILVREGVKNALEAAKITNIAFKRISDFERTGR